MTRLAEAEDGAGRYRAQQKVRYVECLDIPAVAHAQYFHGVGREDDCDEVRRMQENRPREEKHGRRVVRLVFGALDLELLGNRRSHQEKYCNGQALKPWRR